MKGLVSDLLNMVNINDMSLGGNWCYDFYIPSGS